VWHAIITREFGHFFFRNSHFDSYNIAICEWRVWKTKEGSTELHIILSLFGQNAYIRNHLIMFLYQLYRKQMLCIIMCLSSLCVENKNEVSPMPKQGQTKFALRIWRLLKDDFYISSITPRYIYAALKLYKYGTPTSSSRSAPRAISAADPYITLYTKRKPHNNTRVSLSLSQFLTNANRRNSFQDKTKYMAPSMASCVVDAYIYVCKISTSHELQSLNCLYIMLACICGASMCIAVNLSFF